MKSRDGIVLNLEVNDVAICRSQHLQHLLLSFLEQIIQRINVSHLIIKHDVIAEEQENLLGYFPVHLTGTRNIECLLRCIVSYIERTLDNCLKLIDVFLLCSSAFITPEYQRLATIRIIVQSLGDDFIMHKGEGILILYSIQQETDVERAWLVGIILKLERWNGKPGVNIIIMWWTNHVHTSSDGFNHIAFTRSVGSK